MSMGMGMGVCVCVWVELSKTFVNTIPMTKYF